MIPITNEKNENNSKKFAYYSNSKLYSLEASNGEDKGRRGG
jgi:hypothetical protein